MIDLEERLRRELDAAATTQGVPPDFDDRVARRVSVVRRRRAAGRVTAAVIVVVGIVGGVAALRQDSPAQMAVAGGPTGGAGWHPVAAAPIRLRFQALSVAMGDRVLVWGGYDKNTLLDGAVYDATHNTWTKVPDSPFSSGDAIGAWTGREVIVVSGGGRAVVAAAYDPEANSWRRLAAPPLANGASAMNHALWTGSELVVVGVADEGERGSVDQVAVYDPAADSWRKGSLPSGPLPDFGDAVWTGTEVAVVGNVNGSGKSVGTDTLQAYDPAADRWREIPWGLDGVRGGLVVAWTGDRLFVGGGHRAGARLRDAALVDLATETWDRVSDAPLAFEGNNRFGELWTGTTVLTLEGEGGRPVAFDPTTRTWQVGPASSAGRREEVAWVWVGPLHSAMVWSGGSSSNRGPGPSSCCTPIEGGETYTP